MRKIIMLVVGGIAAVVGFVLPALGITDSNLPGVVGSLGIILSYVFFEAKADIARIKDGMQQLGKWTDPAFWVGLIGAILAYLSGELGLNLPLELISGLLVVVIPLLIKLFRKEQPEPTA